jgi:hypothetical protein
MTNMMFFKQVFCVTKSSEIFKRITPVDIMADTGVLFFVIYSLKLYIELQGLSLLNNDRTHTTNYTKSELLKILK